MHRGWRLQGAAVLALLGLQSSCAQCGRDPLATSPPSCGNVGQPCCPGGSAAQCNGGLRCVGDASPVCRLCGEAGQDCCPGRSCGPDLRCGVDLFGSRCVACGARDQPCCPSARCRGRAVCVEGGFPVPTCVACGEAGQRCCPGDPCEPGHFCASPTDFGLSPQTHTNSCVLCGRIGQFCCRGAACEAGSACGSDGRCAADTRTCGRRGQPCCPTGRCDRDFTCAPGPADGGLRCLPCGGPWQPCCEGDACIAPGRCAFQDGSLVCAPCGARGMACCNDRTCLAGVCLGVSEGARCRPTPDDGGVDGSDGGPEGRDATTPPMDASADAEGAPG